MNSALLGLVVSSFLVVTLSLFFSFEKKRGARVAERMRMRADVLVLKSAHAFHMGVHYLGRDLVRQVAHYLFHSLLRATLEGVKVLEVWVRNVMRINKTLAKRAERESVVRSKLEEIAIHKAANALSEDEKRIRKANELRGDSHT